MAYRVRDAGGVERWILDTGLPRFSGKDFDGYVGSAVDITRLGRAHAELSNLSRQLMQAHERERAALATTLREDLCQRMAALTLRLHNLVRRGAKSLLLRSESPAPDEQIRKRRAAFGRRTSRGGLRGRRTIVSLPSVQRSHAAV
jgi:hypothetical protein